MTPENYFSSYFQDYRTKSGLIQDRASNKNICSTAAAGFGNAVLSLTCNKQDAIDKINQTLDTLTKSNPDKNRGWLYHFTTPDGQPTIDTEMSTIDTAIFYTGTRFAANIIKDESLISRTEKLISSIDVDWMMNDKLLRHGIKWQEETMYFIPYFWDNYDEGIIAYRLFGLPYNPKVYNYDLPIFVYYYPLAFYPHDEEIKLHLNMAIKYHMSKYGHLVTATDTKDGYQAFAIGYISPLAMYTLNLSNEMPTIHSCKDGWRSIDRIAIDEGAAFLLRSLVFNGDLDLLNKDTLSLFHFIPISH